MINDKYFACYDLETSGLDTATLDVWQVCCVLVEPRTLKILEEEKFQSYIRPESLLGVPNDSPLWAKYKVDTKGASDINHINTDLLKDSPTTEQVFKKLNAFTNNYGKDYKAPISLGFNNIKYDNVIIDRFSRKFGLIKRNQSSIFNGFMTLDLAHECFGWFENLEAGPENSKLDTFRDFLGISRDGAHNAIKDVIDTAQIYFRFLQLKRKIVGGLECRGCGKIAKSNFRNAFKS